MHYLVINAFHSIIANRMRAGLTLLGIAIGIAAVILITSLGTSTSELILGEIRGLGADTLVVQGGREVSGFEDFSETLLSDSLKERDLEALRKRGNAPHIEEVMPIVIVPGAVTSATDAFSGQTIGADADFMSRVYDLFPAEGVLFGEEEIRQLASVAVIGSRVREELFGNEEAIGEKITVGGKKFRVIGVLPPKGDVAFLNFDDLVIVPYTTAQRTVLNISHYFEFVVRVDDPKNMDITVTDVKATLRETHNLEEGEESDFKVRTPAALIEQIGTVLSILTVFLSSVVAIALVVGGVGVMNITLVAVTERTREIGLRKAVGATERDILLQFLGETILLASLGGFIGIVLGAVFSLGAAVILRAFVNSAWTFVFPLDAALLSLCVSGLVGLVFGIYPARKAAHKNPIEALRYE